MQTHLSQLPLPSTTPPTDSVVSVLGWVVAMALVGGILIWRLRERDRASQLADLKAEHAADEVRVESLRRRIEELQEQRLTDERKRAVDNRAMADILLRNERARPPSEHPEADDDDYRDIPTGVAHEIVKRAALPPNRPPEPAYRPRQQSRPLVEINDPRPPRKPR